MVSAFSQLKKQFQYPAIIGPPAKWRFAGGPTVIHLYMLTVLLHVLTAYP